MFPNVRLLVLALLASIVALSFEFGVFAAFRVNHEPLSRLPADTTTLQLVADESPAPAGAWVAPIGSGAQPSEAEIGAPADAPAVTPLGRQSIAPPNPVSMGVVNREKTSQGAQQGAPAPTASATAAASPPVPAQQTQQRTAVEAQPPQPKAAETQAARSAAELNQDTAGQNSEPAKPAVVQAIAAIARSQMQPLADERPAEVTAKVPEAATPEEQVTPQVDRTVGQRPLRRIARKPDQRQRIAVRRRPIRKVPAPSIAQFGGENPSFQAPVFQSAPAGHDKTEARHRTAQKTARNTNPDSPFAGPTAP
jgi:hypothetical protein